MILRGPTLSEQRFALVQMPAPIASLPIKNGANDLNTALKSTAKLDAKTEQKHDRLRMLEPADAVIVKSEPTERALAFEQVVAWLAVQDVATRNACAAILASEVTHIHEAAKSDGFEVGRGAGEAAAAKDAKLHLETLDKVVAAAERAFSQEQTQMQNICVEIIAETLTKIAGPLLASEAAVIGMVREVLGRVKEGREIILRVSRDDLLALRKFENELAGALPGRKLELLADARVELGGCIVETKLGSLDGRLEVQLRELYETLRLAKLSAPETV